MNEFAILHDAGADAAAALTLALPPESSIDTVADVLEQLYAADPAVDVVAVRVGPDLAMVTSRAHIDALVAPARWAHGAGDGATLPGESARYRLLRLRCPACGAEQARLHLDPGDPPVCAAGHGPLDLLP